MVLFLRCPTRTATPVISAFGGGIYSTGTLIVERSAILDNQLFAGSGSDGRQVTSGIQRNGNGGNGGLAFGAGIYVPTVTHSFTRARSPGNEPMAAMEETEQPRKI